MINVVRYVKEIFKDSLNLLKEIFKDSLKFLKEIFKGFTKNFQPLGGW